MLVLEHGHKFSELSKLASELFPNEAEECVGIQRRTEKVVEETQIKKKASKEVCSSGNDGGTKED